MAGLEVKNLSLQDLENLGDLIPGVGNFARRLLCESYEDFVEVLNDDLDSIIFGLQENPELLRKDSEDRLTTEIKRTLRLLGYQATHDEKIRGHSDLVVRGSRNYLWLGEAKIHSSYNYLFQGFQQLTTRYSTGESNQSVGGLIVYIRRNNAAGTMKTWRTRLKQQKLTEYSDTDCTKRPGLAFHTTHKHQASGTAFHVRHMAVMLGFDPKDKKK